MSATSYRSGVLMGNWSEDAFGVSILRSDVSNNQQTNLNSHTQLSYNTQGLDEAHNEMLATRMHQTVAQPLSSEMLIGHSAAPTTYERYTTDYNRAYGERDDNHSLAQSLRDKHDSKRAENAQDEKEQFSRDRSYQTTSSLSYSSKHSILASNEKPSRFLVNNIASSTLAMPPAVQAMKLRQ